MKGKTGNKIKLVKWISQKSKKFLLFFHSQEVQVSAADLN